MAERFTHGTWDTWELNSASIPALSTLPSTFDCASSGLPQLTYTAVQGSAYVRIEPMLYPDANRPSSGTVSVEEATMTIVQCPSGSYKDGDSCTACPKGKYSDLPNTLTGGAWPENYANPATSPDACQECEAGTFSSLTGASSAFDCHFMTEHTCRYQGLW